MDFQERVERLRAQCKVTHMHSSTGTTGGQAAVDAERESKRGLSRARRAKLAQNFGRAKFTSEHQQWVIDSEEETAPLIVAFRKRFGLDISSTTVREWRRMANGAPKRSQYTDEHRQFVMDLPKGTNRATVERMFRAKFGLGISGATAQYWRQKLIINR